MWVKALFCVKQHLLSPIHAQVFNKSRIWALFDGLQDTRAALHLGTLTWRRSAGTNLRRREAPRGLTAAAGRKALRMAKSNRPLSPHLQVYRLPVSAWMSITHRFTGVVLCFGAILLTYWLMAATYGELVYADAQAILGSLIGQLVLIGVVFSLWYHFCNGIRHLIWDTGRGLELPSLQTSGLITIAAAVVLSVLTLAAAYM